MYECCEIRKKRNWSIRIKRAGRALDFEISNPNNAHENASAFANNIANQAVEDRTVVGGRSWSLSCQRRFRGIRAAIAPVSCERCRTGKSGLFYLVFSQSASLLFAAADSSSSQSTSGLRQSVHNHSQACLRAMDSDPLITRASIVKCHIHATSQVTVAPTPPRTIQQESPKTCTIWTAEP